MDEIRSRRCQTVRRPRRWCPLPRAFRLKLRRFMAALLVAFLGSFALRFMGPPPRTISQ